MAGFLVTDRRGLKRARPAGPVNAYASFRVANPRATHTRPATCAEVDCQPFLNGFMATCNEATDLGRRQAAYLREHRRDGRERNGPGGTEFLFPPGSRCLATNHRVLIDRPPLCLIRPGDWRGNPAGRSGVRQVGVEEWVERFALNQDKVAERVKRG